jgi:hypothetical protein
MAKYFRKREPNPAELTWEEKHPKSYLYKSNDSIKELKKIVEENGDSLNQPEKDNKDKQK